MQCTERGDNRERKRKREREREREREKLTYRVDKYVTNLLVNVPMFNPVPQAIQKPFVEVVNFWDLVEYVLD